MGPDVGPGVEFAGYRVEILLGRGGMGAVYRARDLRLQRRVALKILAADLAEDDRFRERFIRESQLAAAIDHPNIIPIYEAGEAEGALFIAMRYVAGSDLKKDLLQNGRLSLERTGEIVSAAARALDAAHHDGLVHRDVKPANILLARRTDDDSGEHVYLSDFGLTKRTSSKSGITRTGEFLGTVDYVAPEHIEGGELGPASDQYSLGCTAFECLTGDVPFRKDTDLAVLWAHVREQPAPITFLRPELGPGVDAVLTRALAKSPIDRYPTCREFAADLVAALESHEAARPAQAQVPRADPSRTRVPLLRKVGMEGRPSKRLALVAGGVVAVVAAAAFVIAALHHAPNKKPPSRGTVAPPGAIVRIDPEIDKVVKRIRLGSPSTVAVGFGSVWVNDLGTIVRIDSSTDKVVDRIHGPDGYVTPGVQVVTGAGAVWSAGRAGRSRVDPKTSKLRRLPWHDNLPRTTGDGNLVAAGALWETTPAGFVFEYTLDNRLIKVFKVGTSVGANPIAFGDGAIWVVETAPATLVRIDPHKNRVVQKIPLEGDATGVAAGEGGVWGHRREKRASQGIQQQGQPASGSGADPERRLGARGRGRERLGAQQKWRDRHQGGRGYPEGRSHDLRRFRDECGRLRRGRGLGGTAVRDVSAQRLPCTGGPLSHLGVAS